MKPWMSDMYNSGLASGQLCTAVCRSMTSSVFFAFTSGRTSLLQANKASVSTRTTSIICSGLVQNCK